MLDENLPPRMARSLQALFPEHEILALREKFESSGVADLTWITALGSEGGWTILTADTRISKNRIEKQAFLTNNLVGFVMAPALRKRQMTYQMARILLMWETFERQSKMVSRGLFQFGIKTSILTTL